MNKNNLYDVTTFMSPKSQYAPELEKKLNEINNPSNIHKLSLLFSSFGSRTKLLIDSDVRDIYFYELVLNDHVNKIYGTGELKNPAKINFTDDDQFRKIIHDVLKEKYDEIIKKYI